MQPVDFTTLSAALVEIRTGWLPARLEQVRQDDYQSVQLLLRNLSSQRWLVASCHPQAARLHFCEGTKGKGARLPFGSALHQHLFGKVLVECVQPPWERVVRLGFASRPQAAPEWFLHIEIMGKYSNLVLSDGSETILALAHSVSSSQSRVRPLQFGERYTPPPPLVGPPPSLAESFTSWQQRLVLVPGALATALLKNYRGVSKILVRQMLSQLDFAEERPTQTLGETDWQQLHVLWQAWLHRLQAREFEAGQTQSGYTVVGWGVEQPAMDLHRLLDRYYTEALATGTFRARRNRLEQVLRTALAKARKRFAELDRMYEGSGQAETYKQQADLLMAHLHEGRPGLQSITLADFETGEPVAVALNPARDLVSNAQDYYRRHRKAKRAAQTLIPLLEKAREEVVYLEQVAAVVELLADTADSEALIEVEEELIEQGFLSSPGKATPPRQKEVPFYQFVLPGERLVLVGRNNRQNERLTFEVAGADDLWFHAQEIPGAHVVLRLGSGQSADPSDLQWAANVAAYYSKARGSTQVPVIYTERRHVRKLRGGRPGLVTFQRERVTWGRPEQLPQRRED